MFSGIGSGMLGLEMPLHPQQQQNPQNNQNSHNLHPHAQMVSYAQHDADHHQQPQQNVKQGFQFVAKSTKQQLSPHSDEDEPGFNGEDGNGDEKRKVSPWQRMKWTDSMVRLLIMAVYYIGDEAVSEGNGNDGKKKAGGLLQKKGKWKSVSRAMMEKGFYVSPQQCEDKFNDLNKRYKRVNDILGKGTACRVVENQSLLETMDIAPKMKEEVRKLLNSKHLFFREMCAYHNSCNHTAAAGANHSPEVAVAEPSQIQQQRCLHSSDNAHVGANSSRIDSAGSKLGTKMHSDEDDDDEEENDDSDDDEGHSKGQGHDEDEENDERPSRKRARLVSLSPMIQQFKDEIAAAMQDGTKSFWEKKQWIKVRQMQLEEQQLNYQCEAYDLEKQRLKWIKFSNKKERELEKVKMESEKKRLDNERMMMLVRQKEIELLEYQSQHHPQRGDHPSSVTGSIVK